MSASQARMQRIATIMGGLVTGGAADMRMFMGAPFEQTAALLVQVATTLDIEIERREDERQQGAARRTGV